MSLEHEDIAIGNIIRIHPDTPDIDRVKASRDIDRSLSAFSDMVEFFEFDSLATAEQTSIARRFRKYRDGMISIVGTSSYFDNGETAMVLSGSKDNKYKVTVALSREYYVGFTSGLAAVVRESRDETWETIKAAVLGVDSLVSQGAEFMNSSEYMNYLKSI